MLKKVVDILRVILGPSSSSKTQIPSREGAAATRRRVRIEALLREEFVRCQYFKPEEREFIIGMWLHGKGLPKPGRQLSADEKKALGLNPRMKIKQELVELLSPVGLSLRDPRDAWSIPKLRAGSRQDWRDTVEKARQVGARKFKWRSPLTPDDCAWCNKNGGKEFGLDIVEQVEMRCSCDPYLRGYVDPVFRNQDGG